MAYNPNAPYSPNFPSGGDKGFAPPPEMNVVSIKHKKTKTNKKSSTQKCDYSK